MASSLEPEHSLLRNKIPQKIHQCEKSEESEGKTGSESTLISLIIWEGNGVECWQPGGQSLLNSRASSLDKGSPGTFSILLKVVFTSLLMSATKNKEQILSSPAFLSSEADSWFQTLPILASHYKGHGKWGKDIYAFKSLSLWAPIALNAQRHGYRVITNSSTRPPITPGTTHLLFHQNLSADLMNSG